MAKISKKEYEILKSLGDHWEWMARDENGQLYKYMDKPRKINDFNWNDPAETWLRMNDDGFKFIQFSDSEPYSIVELIEEYEYSADHVSHVLNERVKALGNAWKESEETEVKKNKKGLVKYLEKEISNFKPGQMIYDYLTFILKQVKQLDEPEATLKKEPKYNVSFRVKSSFGTVGVFLYKQGDEVLAGDNFKAYYPKEDEFRLTEQEIRSFQNGDVLFEHFAVKVEEVE